MSIASVRIQYAMHKVTARRDSSSQTQQLSRLNLRRLKSDATDAPQQNDEVRAEVHRHEGCR